MTALLSRKSYRELIRDLEVLKKEYEQDRSENPSSLPLGFGTVIPLKIEYILRNNRERFSRDLPKKVMDYLVEKGTLVNYHGDYTFPGEPIPSKEEFMEHVKKTIDSLIDLP